MSKVVKIAQVGCGHLAQTGTLAHLALDDVKDKVQLVATMDVDAERAKFCMKKFGAKEWYDDYEKMLSEVDIDAVTIATPIGLHYEQVMKAIEAGKHVHCNKTIATTAKEATDIIKAARRNDVKVVASPGNSARSPIIRKAKQLIEDGTVGKVYWAQMLMLGTKIRGKRKLRRKTDPTWYFKSGGPMYDKGVYLLHSITALLGPAKRVTAMSGIGVKERIFMEKKINVEMDDNTLLLLDFEESTFAFISSTYSMGQGACRFYMTCSDGSIRAESANASEMEVWSLKIPRGKRVEKLSYKGYLPYVEQLDPIHMASRTLPRKKQERLRESLRLETLPGETHVFNDVMHLVHCIINDEEPIVVDKIESMEHARHVIEIIEKGYIAAKTGKTQELETTFNFE